MSKFEETINQSGEKEFHLQDNEEVLQGVLLNGVDKELAEDVLLIHKYCEEVDMFAMLTQALEEFVRLFRDQHNGNRVNLRHCQIRVSDYRDSFMTLPNSLPMDMADDEMLDAFLVQENTGYSILYIPCIENQKARFWYASNDKIRNIKPVK